MQKESGSIKTRQTQPQQSKQHWIQQSNILSEEENEKWSMLFDLSSFIIKKRYSVLLLRTISETTSSIYC